jgi:hypothetical protein
MDMNLTKTLVAGLLVAAPALAQNSNVAAWAKYSWSENCGWMNWRDAGSPAGSQGAVVGGNFLSGFVWCENIGWINLGDGSPGNGTAYANTAGTDFGVNRNPATGMLTGMAWGENIGWINFAAGAMANPAQPARVESSRLRGFAWGENIGWINLDDATRYVSLGCYANCDQSTVVPVLNVQDFVCFLNRFQTGDPYANCDESTTAPVLNVQDFSCFLNRFAQGCP